CHTIRGRRHDDHGSWRRRHGGHALSEAGIAHACAAGGERKLTAGERALARSVFGTAIDYDAVSMRRRRWFPLQPRKVLMAPCGHIHFHPGSPWYCDDFSEADLGLQGLFVHEMTHVWQAQTRGKWF